jgi:hypothetical protein
MWLVANSVQHAMQTAQNTQHSDSRAHGWSSNHRAHQPVGPLVGQQVVLPVELPHLDALGVEDVGVDDLVGLSVCLVTGCFESWLKKALEFLVKPDSAVADYAITHPPTWYFWSACPARLSSVSARCSAL